MSYHHHDHLFLTDALLDARATKAINRRASEERAASTGRAELLATVSLPGSPQIR